jgi:hypothetical protein
MTDTDSPRIRVVSTAGNMKGTAVVLEAEHFKYFDMLPRPVREALASAAYSMAAEKIVEWMLECRKGGMDDYQIADLILFRFRQYIAQKTKDETLRLYGPEHPQAGPPIVR